nr:YlxR family protein [Brochothrix thermosphacta]
MMVKKTPLRKCIITNERLPKQDLLRITYSKDGTIVIDPGGKLPGRGAYITKSVDVAKKAKKRNSLGTAFNAKNDLSTFYDDVITYLENEVNNAN